MDGLSGDDTGKERDHINLAERSLVYSIIANPDMLSDADVLDMSDFDDGRLGAVFWACQESERKGVKPGLVSLVDILKAADMLKQAGGQDFLWNLHPNTTDDSLVGTADFKDSVRIIRDASRRRALLRAAAEVRAKASDSSVEVDHIVQSAETSFLKIGQGNRVDGSQKLGSIMDDVRADMSLGSRRAPGCMTGFGRLDSLTGGLKPGQLWIIAARPGIGKSALALQMALNIARRGKRVWFASYEMQADEIGYRAMSVATEFSSTDLMAGNIPDDAQTKIDYELDKLSKLDLTIDDSPPGTIAALKSAVRREAARGAEPLDAVFVDYLQLLESNKRRDASRNDEVSDITRGLKTLASDLSIPVVALSQLSRNVENRSNNRPRLHDLRDSGSIEQDANVVIFLYRPPDGVRGKNPDHAEFIVAKQRSGPCGTIKAKFIGQSTRFEEIVVDDGQPFD